MIYIVTIPGIGSKKNGYSKKFVTDIYHFSKHTHLEKKITCIETLPFSITNIDLYQTQLFNRLDSKNNLGGLLSFRKFVLEAFGDAVTFERDRNTENSPYKRMHRYLKKQFESIQLEKNDKLVIVAESMGVQLLYTYICDADLQAGIFEKEKSNDTNNLRNLSYLATCGCNLPLFFSGFPESEIIAFEKRNSQFIWENFYDKNDVLGWPLNQLSSSFNSLVNDYEINTGMYIGSHVKYWGDNSFTKHFFNTILSL
jgi:hypothetical protein